MFFSFIWTYECDNNVYFGYKTLTKTPDPTDCITLVRVQLDMYVCMQSS